MATITSKVRIHFIALLVFALFSSLAFGALTPQQLTTLKTDINANSATLSIAIAQRDGPTIAAFYNAIASPSFTVWKSMVPINLIGKAFDNTELAGLTTANQTRLQTLAMFLAGGVDPSQATNRAFFDDIFSGAGGANTRVKLLSLWKRLATRAEKLFAIGTGSDAAPATLVMEGTLSGQDILNALDS